MTAHCSSNRDSYTKNELQDIKQIEYAQFSFLIIFKIVSDAKRFYLCKKGGKYLKRNRTDECRKVVEEIIYYPRRNEFFDLEVIKPGFFLNTCDVPGWIFHKISLVSSGGVN